MNRAVLSAVLLATLALAAPARAADPVPIPILHDREATSFALSGPDVLVLENVIHKPAKLLAIPRTGGQPRTLLTVPHAEFDSGVVEASAQRVAVAIDVEGKPGEHRVYAGPPSGPLQLVHSARGDRDQGWTSAGVWVDGDRVVLAETVPEISIGDDEDGETGLKQFRASILDGSGWKPIPWADGTHIPVAFSGQFAAMLTFAPKRLEVVDVATGTPVYTVNGTFPSYSADADLLPDGRIAVGTERGIDLAGPGQPQANLANSGRLGWPRFAGGWIAALDDANDRLALYRGDGTHIELGPRSLLQSGIEADADGVAWLFNGCLRYAPLTPVTVPKAKDPCPTFEISLYFLGAHSKLHGNHARVPVRCVAAATGRCRGELLLRAKRGGPIVGRAHFSLPPSEHDGYVKVHFTRASVAKFRRERHGYLHVYPKLHGGTVAIDGPDEDFEFDVEVD